MADAITLPDGIVEWIGEATGGTVTGMSRVPGGASREAWFIDVDGGPWSDTPLFLRYSRVTRPQGGAFHSLRVESEIFSALEGTDVTVPPIVAVHPTEEAALAVRTPGETWFYRIKDPDEQVRVAQDFIRNLAAMHRLDPAALHLPSLQPVKTVREHVLDEIASMRRRASRDGEVVDPMVRVSLEWLEKGVPAYDGPVVLVQGDTGPGNFMYADGKVTAVVDFELAHFGDPMDDIAWLSLRTVQDTFTHLPDRLREYEQLSGHTVDEDRVWYYRLYAETRLNANDRGGSRDDAEVAAKADAAPRDIGNGLIYGILHRRLTLEALGHVMGLDLPMEPLPEEDDPEDWHHLYDAVLGSLQVIVPRIQDPLASQWTKGVARVVKYLKELDRGGRSFASAELDDLTSLLGSEPSSVGQGRRALAAANREGQVSDEDYIVHLWRQVRRDDHLMRTASGALNTRSWPPLH